MVEQHADGVCDAKTWEVLASEICASEQVTMVGILPRPLLEALRQRLATDPNLVGSLPTIRYLTPLPEAVLSGDVQRAQTHVAHRWQVGFMGLRNLIQAAGVTGQPIELQSSLASLPSVFLDCIVRLVGAGGHSRVRFLCELPSSPHKPAVFLQLIPRASGGAQLEAYVDGLAKNAPPLRLREVLCDPLAECDAGEQFNGMSNFRVQALAPYGGSTIVRRRLKPVAVVVVRCGTPNGLHVLLKSRTQLTDSDDFDKLSLLSARVQEADLADAFDGRVSESSEDSRALDEMWVQAGKPREGILVPMDAFTVAAQRELFVTCGLEIEPDRLSFRGFRIVEHEDGREQLGFAVFVIDLQRTREFDEMRFAMDRAPQALVSVPIDLLYSGEHQLNRLLRIEQDWLTEHVFSAGIRND